MEPVSVVGPWGNDWMFISPEEFKQEYPGWWDEFMSIYEGDGTASEGECKNDDMYKDDYDDTCEWYSENPDMCGQYDSDERWTAAMSCCACGGGYYDSDIVWSGYLVDPNGSGDMAFIWVETEEMTEIYYWYE